MSSSRSYVTKYVIVFVFNHFLFNLEHMKPLKQDVSRMLQRCLKDVPRCSESVHRCFEDVSRAFQGYF